MEVYEVQTYPWGLSSLSIQLLYDLERDDLGAKWANRLNRFGKEAFEAGKQEGMKIGIVSGVKDISLLSKEELDNLNSLAESYLESVRQEGMKEVVEQINSHALYQTVGLFMKPIPLEDCGWWQAKLKSWNIRA